MQHSSSFTWDVTKHGDQCPSLMGINWVSDRVGFDFIKVYAYQKCSLLIQSRVLLEYFCILFDVKILNIIVCAESGAGCMCVCVDGVLVFVHVGCD